MGIYYNERVQFPESGCFIKRMTQSKKPYVYKYTRYYRNKDGKSRNEAKAIGLLDEDTGMLIPNDNYYAILSVLPPCSCKEPLKFGYGTVIFKLAQKLGLDKCLTHAFGDLSIDLLTMAAYMLYEETNVMQYCEDWLDDFFIPNREHSISSQYSSDVFAGITEAQKDVFFKEWVAVATDAEHVCYDVTSVSSYSGMEGVEFGYNRDHEDLPQINIGMFCGEKTRLPVYYNVYNGSITDSVNLPYVF